MRFSQNHPAQLMKALAFFPVVAVVPTAWLTRNMLGAKSRHSLL